MITLAFLNASVTIRRRTDTSIASRDVLNNPIYGSPVDGSWTSIYTSMPVKLAFSSKEMTFPATGERVVPSGIMYYNPPYTLQLNDRVITSDNIEYVVLSIVPGYLLGTIVDHFEAILSAV